MDPLIKLVLVGDSDVGKSGLLLRFCEDSWASFLHATIGVEFKVRTIELDGKIIKLQIWDTSGRERFRTLIPAYYRDAMGILLVYDVTDEHSFSNIRRWYSGVKAYAQEGVNTILVGNKCYGEPEDKRVVTTERGQKLADELGIKFFETSAKLNVGVEDAFFTIASDITTRLIDSQPQPDNTANLSTASDFVYVARPTNYKFA